MSLSIDTRAEFAAMAVTMYALKKEGRNHYDAPEDMAADLIGDLLHYIRAHDADPLMKLRTAQMNFEAEEAEEQKPTHRLEVQ